MLDYTAGRLRYARPRAARQKNRISVDIQLPLFIMELL